MVQALSINDQIDFPKERLLKVIQKKIFGYAKREEKQVIDDILGILAGIIDSNVIMQNVFEIAGEEKNLTVQNFLASLNYVEVSSRKGEKKVLTQNEYIGINSKGKEIEFDKSHFAIEYYLTKSKGCFQRYLAMPKHHVNKLEKLLHFLIELVVIIDLLGDIIVFVELAQTNNIFWAVVTIFCILTPYLISYSPLVTFFIERRPKGNLTIIFAQKTACILLLSPFCFVYLLFIDIASLDPIDLFLKFITCDRISFVDIDTVVNKHYKDTFGFTIMDTKGYKRLRSISQLMFESLPMILLVTRVLTFGIEDYLISTEILLFSQCAAIFHAILEIMVLKLESKASKSTFLRHRVISLNGRFNWVPFIEKFNESSNHKGKIYDYSNISYRLWKFEYKMYYEFLNETIDILCESISYFPLNHESKQRPTIRLGTTADNVSLVT